MEMENYFIANRETGKLNIYTSKAFYTAMPVNQKKVISRFCLFSRSQDCWVSKAKIENCNYLKVDLLGLGFTDGGVTGEKLSFEAQVNREMLRAENRAERSEKRAENAQHRSNELYETARKMQSVIPLGQPILIGHHSEKGDRNYRNKIHNKFEKAFEESDKAEHYNRKAENARYTAEGKKYSNPKYLINRLKECEKLIRICERRLSGKYNPGSPIEPISASSKIFYHRRISEETEKHNFFTEKMKIINPEWVSVKESANKSKGKKL